MGEGRTSHLPDPAERASALLSDDRFILKLLLALPDFFLITCMSMYTIPISPYEKTEHLCPFYPQHGRPASPSAPSLSHVGVAATLPIERSLQ